MGSNLRSTSNKQHPSEHALWTHQKVKCSTGCTSIALKQMCDRLQNRKLLSHIGSMLGHALSCSILLSSGLRQRPSAIARTGCCSYVVSLTICLLHWLCSWWARSAASMRWSKVRLHDVRRYYFPMRMLCYAETIYKQRGYYMRLTSRPVAV